MKTASKPTLLFVFLVLSFLLLTSFVSLADSDDQTVLTPSGKLLYAQPAGQASGVCYTSVIRLQYSGAANGRLLATFFDPWNANGNGIYQSNNDGYTWTAPISYLKDTQRGSNYVLWEPHLFELPQACGNLPAGTILCAVRSFGQPGIWNWGCDIQIYYSTNQGTTWAYRGQVQYSEPFGTYEPHLAIASGGQLVCFWSDETTCPEGDQALVHKVSTDGGLTWGPMVTDVKVAGMRPGMATVAKLGNGAYAMCYEVVRDAASKVHYRVSSDGLNWGTVNDLGPAVQTASGAYAGACPYITWVPGGGPNGQLVVSSTFVKDTPLADRQLFVNGGYGWGEWHMIPAPVQWQGGSTSQAQGYTQALLPTKDGHGVLQIASSVAGTNQNNILFGKASVYFPTNVVSGQTYFLTNKLSGLNLDNAYNAQADGNTIWQWYQNGGDAQMWTFTFSENAGGVDYFFLENVGGSTSTLHRELDVSNGSTADGAQVWLWQRNGSWAQQWRILPQSDGSVILMNRNSGKVLDMSVSASPMTSAKQWTNLETPTQKWYLMPILPPGQLWVAKNNVTSALAMEVSGGSQVDSALVLLGTYSAGAARQIWTSYALPNGAFQLLNLNSGKALDTSGSTGVGVYPVQYTWSTSNSNQYWYIQPILGSRPLRYRLTPYNGTSVCLEDKNAGTTNGTPIQHNTWSGMSRQLWDFIDVTP